MKYKRKDTLLNNEQKKELLTLTSAILSRSKIADQLGQSFGGDRDLYTALGYPKENQLTFDKYYARYKRDGLSQRIVNAPVTHSWRLKPIIEEKNKADGKETLFEKQWGDLVKDKGIYHYLTRVDKLSGIGMYGVLFIGLNDNSAKLEDSVTEGKHQLMYLRPFKEDNACIKEFETDINNERYGLPTVYELKSTIPNSNSTSTSTVKVHHTRILHVAEGLLEDDVFGTPGMESVFNNLMDVEKVTGGSAEMFWRGAFPGLAFTLDKDAKLSPQAESDLEDELERYFHRLQRSLKLKGMDVKNLAPQVADPSKHFDILISIIAAAKEMPKRILMGSETGERSSQQDEIAWSKKMDERRLNYNEPMILRKFITKMGDFGILNIPEEGYNVIWPDIIIPTDKDKAEVAKFIVETLAIYANSIGADMIIPPEVLLEKIMGFSKDEIENIRKTLEGMVDEEEDAQEIEDRVRKEIEKENKGTE